MAGFRIEGNVSGNVAEVTTQNELKVAHTRKSANGTLAALNAEVTADMNGNQFAIVTCVSSAFIGTLEFTGCSDFTEANYTPVFAYPVANAWGGAAAPPQSAQPLLLSSLIATNTLATFAVPVGQLRRLRVRASAYTSGNLAVTVTSEDTLSLNQFLNGGPTPATLAVTAVGAVGAAVTATIPAVAGLRHIIDGVQVVRSATAALATSATPVTVTTTNLPGNPAMTFGSDAAGIGLDKEQRMPTASGGLTSTAMGANTTIVCPAYAGVIWRINAIYHLGQ